MDIDGIEKEGIERARERERERYEQRRRDCPEIERKATA